MAKDLVCKLLQPSLSLRYNAESALNHPFITRKYLQKIPETYSQSISNSYLSRKFKIVLGAILFLSKNRKKETAYYELQEKASLFCDSYFSKKRVNQFSWLPFAEPKMAIKDELSNLKKEIEKNRSIVVLESTTTSHVSTQSLSKRSVSLFKLSTNQKSVVKRRNVEIRYDISKLSGNELSPVRKPSNQKTFAFSSTFVNRID